ncbi:DUF3108 domain-containing protein [Polaribacter huanghezhanensis]|uniref:DUF3108 domain-containing protein n=1 Tax=Polaribacter huanghezhanensis TaxID=1354726 RepID=UPI0026484F04|nr:DUF3108 domain-containing protein [Polaribacter huanghezhanensis]
MKKTIFLFIAFSSVVHSYSQEKTTIFKKGEWLRYKMSYSGFLKAGNATLSVGTDTIKGKEVFHVTGKGWTTGIIKWFFNVDDTYQSYFDKETIKPYVFKRNINEGGYVINREIKFNYDTKKATVLDFKLQTTETFDFNNIQDMMSSFYYLRSRDVSNLKVGDEIALDMFMDAQIYPFKLRYLGEELLKTSFGKIKTLKFRPMVQAGRVFKENESVTIWITADENKIPIKLKASLSVGSLKAELDAYKGLANSFEIIYD